MSPDVNLRRTASVLRQPALSEIKARAYIGCRYAAATDKVLPYEDLLEPQNSPGLVSVLWENRTRRLLLLVSVQVFTFLSNC